MAGPCAEHKNWCETLPVRLTGHCLLSTTGTAVAGEGPRGIVYSNNHGKHG